MQRLHRSVTARIHSGAQDTIRAARRLLRAGSFFIVLILCFSPQTQAQVSQDDPDWVTTWSSSPSTLPPAEPVGGGYQNQTVRLIVHTSAGGRAVRLRLSNTHGEKPLVVGAVTVARQANGAEIVPGSARQVSFSSRQSITIPRWATVISDPIEMEIPRTANLAVSLFLPEETGFITTHALSNQANYLSSAGNHVNSTELPVASESTGWPFLTAIDILPEQPIRTIVTLGDSITDGWDSTASANQRWPNHFAQRLYRDSGIGNFAVANAGISGNRVTTEQNPTFGQNLQARFQRDVLALSNVSHIILLEGINDIGMSARSIQPTGASQIIDGYRQIIARAHARGIKVIGATLLPYEGAAYYTEAGNQVRLEVNDFIRSSGEFDGVIEFDKAVQDPADPNRIRSAFTGDNLHPNDAGYRAMAEIIDLDLFK